MLYDLRHSDVRVRWLVTLLLATLGTSYLFGAWMVALYAGFSPRKVAETYGPAGETMMAMQMPPDTTVVTERPVSRRCPCRLDASTRRSVLSATTSH